MKVNQNFLKIIIILPTIFRGIKLPLIKIEQVVEMINLFIILCKTNTLLLILNKDYLEIIQLEIRINQLILE